MRDVEKGEEKLKRPGGGLGTSGARVPHNPSPRHRPSLPHKGCLCGSSSALDECAVFCVLWFFGFTALIPYSERKQLFADVSIFSRLRGNLDLGKSSPATPEVGQRLHVDLCPAAVFSQTSQNHILLLKTFGQKKIVKTTQA